MFAHCVDFFLLLGLLRKLSVVFHVIMWYVRSGILRERFDLSFEFYKEF